MKPSSNIFDNLIIVRGAGDLATATIIRLHNSGFKVIALDIQHPTVIRRTVAFAQAMFDQVAEVEGVTAQLVTFDQIQATIEKGIVPVVVDPDGLSIKALKPTIVVDSIIAKKNLGTNRAMAPFTIALGPGFTAGVDVDCVIETARGHNLGRLIYDGPANPNTGIPGNIEGFSKERVIHSPCSGLFTSRVHIGDIVQHGDIIAYIDQTSVHATIDGMVRGLLNDGLIVPQHFKIADIDPRAGRANYTTCSDKARALSGSVLEAVLHFLSTH